MHYRRQLRGQDLAAPKRGGHFTPVKTWMAHQRVKNLWGPANQYPCIDCSDPAAEWSYDHMDPAELPSRSGPYSLHPEFYAPRCVKCHRRFDTERCGRQRKPCRVDGCEKLTHGLGLCNTHWAAHKRRGVCYN